MNSLNDKSSTPGGESTAAAASSLRSSPPPRSALVTQLPAIVLTVALVVGAMAWMRHGEASQRAADLEPLRAQNEALRAQGETLRVQSEDNRRQIESATKLLKDALARHDGEIFRPEEEIQKLNSDRVDLLADALAKKITPALPPVKTPAELAQNEAAQIDQVASRLTDNLRPMLSGLSADQKAASAQMAGQYEARVRELDQNLQNTQSAAQDALKLSHELSALYLDSFKDKGVLVRLLSLPANLVIDTAHGDIVNGRDRAKVQAELDAKMNALDQRLRSIPTSTAAENKG